MANILTGFWLWQVYDAIILKDGTATYVPPVPLKNPTFPTVAVSILIMTIDTPDEFPTTMRMCLANKPKEIIIVTIPRDYERVETLAAQVQTSIPVHILTVPKPGKRIQMIAGIRKATGDILCFVDDDTIWPTAKVLPYLLAGFEDPKVGGVVGRQSAWIPKDRRDADKLTSWEVAAIRRLSKHNDSQMQLYATCGSIWCLAGRTALVRVEVVRSEKFLYEFTHETWGGQFIDTGEDSFMTHWLRTQGWKLCHQDAREAEVFTEVKQDYKFAWQLVRWQRSGYQALISELFYQPGFFAVYKRNPYLAYRLARELGRLLVTWVHLIGWVSCMRQSPIICVVFALWYLTQLVRSYQEFMESHPWTGLQHLWAAIAVDYVYLLLDFYGLITVNSEAWLTRNVV